MHPKLYLIEQTLQNMSGLLLQQLNRVPQPLQHLHAPDDLHALEQRHHRAT